MGNPLRDWRRLYSENGQLLCTHSWYCKDPRIDWKLRKSRHEASLEIANRKHLFCHYCIVTQKNIIMHGCNTVITYNVHCNMCHTSFCIQHSAFSTNLRRNIMLHRHWKFISVSQLSTHTSNSEFNPIQERQPFSNQTKSTALCTVILVLLMLRFNSRQC
jgi:hypothetical protein